jgi:oxygen-independent coproporphyrinogen-3 oxidase
MAGVYISYPFCAQKCSFCNFASGIHSHDLEERYGPALLEEIREYNWSWKPDTGYLGGGTPNLMPPKLLRDLIASIPSDLLNEVTLECAPGTITRESAGVWREYGINRVSLGAQSFVEQELRQVGRSHTPEIVRREVQLLREGDIANLNIDLIAGLPGQTRESWEDSLNWIERITPPHVSVYIFEIDEDSRLGKEAIRGGTRFGADQLPDDGLVAEFYERAVDRLRDLGIERYEISNFARPGWESGHNLKYWTLEPYIGFGLDAHSFDGTQRWSTPDTFEEYFRREEPRRTANDPGEEHFFVGLRLMEGIEPTHEEWVRFADPIRKWMHAGMLRKDGPQLRLSRDAVLISNEIFQDFLHA